MALELRPNCEYCDRDLPPASQLARICTYECTFCADCADNVLLNVCPNCGGGFAPRPCLLGRSRGGLWVTSWAADNPDKVAGLAGIYPVFDLRTYPGLAKAPRLRADGQGA